MWNIAVWHSEITRQIHIQMENLSNFVKLNQYPVLSKQKQIFLNTIYTNNVLNTQINHAHKGLARMNECC